MEIICYLSNGYPTLEASHQIAREYVDAGCKMMEVDFPARDPYLENEYIAGRMAKALKQCGDYSVYMKSIARIKREFSQVNILLLAYESTVEEIGVTEFIAFCQENNLLDIILVGLKEEQIKNQMIAAGLKVSCYVQFHLPPEEVKSAQASNGFVYLQAKPYVGQPENSKYPTLKSAVDYLRQCGITRPIYCGVGVHMPEDVKMVKAAGADAAFVGSAILKLHENVPMMKEKIREFKNEC